MLLQRLIEFLRAIAQVPLWIAIAAAVPPDFPRVRLYFLVTIILSLVTWTEMARVARGKIIQFYQYD